MRYKRQKLCGRGTPIKPKTARRFLNRNAFKLARDRLKDNLRPTKLLKEANQALKVLRKAE